MRYTQSTQFSVTSFLGLRSPLYKVLRHWTMRYNIKLCLYTHPDGEVDDHQQLLDGKYISFTTGSTWKAILTIISLWILGMFNEHGSLINLDVLFGGQQSLSEELANKSMNMWRLSDKVKSDSGENPEFDNPPILGSLVSVQSLISDEKKAILRSDNHLFTDLYVCVPVDDTRISAYGLVMADASYAVLTQLQAGHGPAVMLCEDTVYKTVIGAYCGSIGQVIPGNGD